jgi:glycosyltransferase involved in cell wall biosynthesis
MVEPVNITMVTYNRLDFTRQSIDSIVKTAGYPYRLTVVDNASHDGTVPLLGELHSQGIVDHLTLNERNLGVAFAANQGWAAGGKAHYVKIDNDIVFRKDGWLARLVEACDRLPDVGAVGFSFEANSYPAETIVGLRLRPKQGNIGGACLMIPERVHLRVGYWCEDYFPYGEEDYDMYVRLRQLGLRSYYMEDEDVGLHLPEGKASPFVATTTNSVFDEGDQAYRLEKDRWRALHAGPRGLRRVNERLYSKGLRPLYVDRGPYRPSVRARLYVLLRYRLLDPWRRPVLRGADPFQTDDAPAPTRD